MCEISKRLKNGDGKDPELQGKGIGEILDRVEAIAKQIRELPTRSEMLETIERTLRTHMESCASGQARKPGESNFFKLTKQGIEAGGGKGVLFGAFVGVVGVVVLAKVAPLLYAWFTAKGGAP